MRASRASTVTLAAILVIALASDAHSGVTVYFDPGQVATPVEIGPTWDTISCDGYLFTYSRDKLFTGGGSEPIGRPVRVAWPQGIEAQYVTAGPAPDKAKITVRRVDGAVFDLTSFTALLLANAGAGRAIEIVPFLNGQEPLNDPLSFDVSGSYGNAFSYDTSPNPLGSTAALVDYDAYAITLTLDYALTALTLTSASTTAAPGLEPTTLAGADLVVFPNPASRGTQVSLSVLRPRIDGRICVYTFRGARVRTLVLDASGHTFWDLRDQSGQPVATGSYFMRMESATGVSRSERVVVVK